jgi:hypothetical protein
MRKLLLAFLLGVAGMSHSATVELVQPEWGTSFYTTSQVVMPIWESQAFLPLVVGTEPVKVGGAIFGLDPTLGWDWFDAKLWTDTDPSLDAWSRGTLMYHVQGDSQRDPLFSYLWHIYQPGDQLIFELLNLSPGRALTGSMYFNAPFAVVPLPAAAWMFLSGMLALAGLSRGRPRPSS